MRYAVETMIAYCGLTCTECLAYVATQKGDMDALAKMDAEVRRRRVSHKGVA